MKPSIPDLHESGNYRLVESFNINDMMQFVLRELGIGLTSKRSKKAPPKLLPRLVGLVVLLVGGGASGYFVGQWLGEQFTLSELVGLGKQFLVGFLAFFPLISLHEFVHGLAFKQIGAPRVGYGWSWKGMMAYAYAQNHVLAMREVAFVAVMPFLVISTALALAWFIWPQYPVAWVTLLFLHTTGCVGDFVLINFWRKNQHRDIFTYDDVEVERKTYFFERVGEAEQLSPSADAAKQ